MSSRAQRQERVTLAGLPSRTPSPASAGPILKWAGGKSQLLQSFASLFPDSFKDYYEPFTGGGAVYFHLHNTRPAFEARLTDVNAELINCYTVVRDDVEALIRKLKTHQNDKDYFYEIRSLDPRKLSPQGRAARLIFLNKTCFNGLYRVNSKGEFNVPFGSYNKPNFCNQDALRACSKALQNVNLQCARFDTVLEYARRGDFVYFDPPYHPLSETSNFTSYTRDCFNVDDQKHLAQVFAELAKRGCRVMLSNSDTAVIREMYSDFKITTVEATRAINCKSTGRGKITELVVTSY